MIPVYICDDNVQVKDRITKIIDNIIFIHGYDMKIVLSTTNPKEVIECCKEKQVRSIYFFDVDLQNEEYNGFTLAKEIRKLDTRGFIIFVTTYEELMFETFKYRLEALSYLIKDDIDKLSFQIGESLEDIHQLVSQEKGNEQSYYTVQIADTSYQIPMDDIYYFETSAHNHRIILHASNRILEFRGNLNAIEAEVGESFFRVHRSYLVQLNKIQQINYTDNTIILNNDTVCLLSRRGKKQLKDYLENKEHADMEAKTNW